MEDLIYQPEALYVEIVKIVDRIPCTELNSLDFLQINKEYLLFGRSLSAIFDTAECFF